MNENYSISTITIDSHFISVFSTSDYPKVRKGGMILTDRISAENLRIRESNEGYKSDWHVAGDPTLIVVTQGRLRITLRNGEFKDFSTGDMFIARDYLPHEVPFNDNIHGHKAEVIGTERFQAIHIKLEQLSY